MTCASELIEMRKKIVQEYEHEQEEKAKKEYVIACENAVLLCETEINNLLEAEAKKLSFNEKVSITLPISLLTDKLGNKLFKLVVEKPDCYADGSSSYSDYNEEVYSYEVVKNYLLKYCLITSIKKDNFTAKCYGYGPRSWPTIEIITKPEC